MPTANAEGYIDSEGSIGKVSVRRVFRYLQVDTGPRRSPSACAEKLLKIGTERGEGTLNRWSVVSQPSLSTRHRDAEAQLADEEGMMTLMANIAAKRTEMDALVDDQGAAGEEMGREEGERAAWRGVAEESIAANIMAMITRSPVSSGSD